MLKLVLPLALVANLLGLGHTAPAPSAMRAATLAQEYHLLDGLDPVAAPAPLPITGDQLLAGGRKPPGGMVHVDYAALTATDSTGAMFSWQNTTGNTVIVNRLIVDITTTPSGACTMDAGYQSGTYATSTVVDNLIDGADIRNGGTAHLRDNVSDLGTNGKGRQKITRMKWVTGSKASGAASGLAGTAYIFYHLARQGI